MVETTTLAGTVDFSFWGLFIQADFVVKSVIIMLIASSIWSWTIIIDKFLRFKKLTLLATRFEKRFWDGEPLDDMLVRAKKRPEDPIANVFATALNEWKRITSKKEESDASHISVQERLERLLQLRIEKEMSHLEKYMGFLATVGSTAPFVGLFGTVWGIMNSFRMIGMMNNTSLSVVAPGIAEALFATALGLIAAIPAVVGYNKLSDDLSRYAARLEFFSAELVSILLRQLEDTNANKK